MNRLTDNKIVLVTRPTRLAELVIRFNTVSQARFYIEHQGADFSDYVREDEIYHRALTDTQSELAQIGRVQTVDRSFLPNFVFAPEDTVVTLGQDGLVANTLKYLDGQPVVGVNPDPDRWDGRLLPFQVRDLAKVMPEVILRKRSTRSVTMAKATLNNGQTMYGVNDLFIGPKTHTSARYVIRSGEVSETHSSSGVVVSTGLGSTGWLTSLLTGAEAVFRTARSVFAQAETNLFSPGNPKRKAGVSRSMLDQPAKGDSALMTHKETIRTSKFLSLVLRHEPERVGLTLDSAGWVEVDALLQSVSQQGVSLSREQLEHIVATSDKKRFAFSDDGRRIRASQGHSVEVDLHYSPAVPPELLYHGTASRFLESIREKGF